MSERIKQGHASKQWRIMGNWEPKMFLLRRGDGMITDVDKLWSDIHNDQAIEHMKRLGISASHIHFHKGYGLEFEAESIREAKLWAQKLHANGIAVGAYIGSSFFTETFKHADFDKMVMHNGYNGWSGAQYFRKFWCYNSPKAICYFKEVIRTAIEEIRADVLHLDNAFCFYHDYLCHCSYCIEGFREFVAKRPEFAAAAGYCDPKLLSIPPLGNGAFLKMLKQVPEAGDAAWISYHSEAGYQTLKSLVDFAKTLNPEICILYNGATLCGITSFSRPHLEMRMLELVDSTVTEDDNENWVHVTADGITGSRFRPYKAAARKKVRALYYTSSTGRNNPLMLAEAAAFGYKSLGIVEVEMQKNHRLRGDADYAMLDYLIENERLFIDREMWHNVAVLRHHESMLFNPYPSGLTPYVVEQMLFESHVPFSIIDEGDVKRGLNGEFDLLILPDCKCLSEEEVRSIETFVSGGGKILVIGNTGVATAINQYRSRWALAQIFDCESMPQSQRAEYQETANSLSSLDEAAEEHIKLDARYGSGRAVYIRGLDFDLPDKSKLNKFGGFDWYYHPYWKKPRNAEEFMAALDELLEPRRLWTNLPSSVGIECYTIHGGWRICFVNFADSKTAGGSKITLRLNDRGNCPVNARWHSPMQRRELEISEREDAVEIVLPEIEIIGTLDIMRGQA